LEDLPERGGLSAAEVETVDKGKTGCVLRLDLKNFFPRGQWERMTPEEKAAWKKKWEAYQKRQKGVQL
jgi:hypothetical protein